MLVNRSILYLDEFRLLGKYEKNRILKEGSRRVLVYFDFWGIIDQEVLDDLVGLIERSGKKVGLR